MIETKKKPELSPCLPPSNNVRIFEYGCRVDKESIPHIQHQIYLSRRLYNELVSKIRTIVAEMQAFVLNKAGPDAQACQADVDALNLEFSEAKARDDEPELKRIAESRRAKWKELAELLKATRKEFRQDIQHRFLSRIGRNSSCDTYQIRSTAVAAGLGWATANAQLDAALNAFKKTFSKGQAPRFAVGDLRDQDSLTLQFTVAGGLTPDVILSGKHGEIHLNGGMGAGRRRYGEFRFRLGAAAAGINATGTWQYHREIPQNAAIGIARLIRRKVGKDFKYAIQVQVKQPYSAESNLDRKPMAAVHFGWSGDTEGRRVAGVADCADPEQARLVRLLSSIEEDLVRASVMQGERDAARDELVPQIKTIEVDDGAINPDAEIDSHEWHMSRAMSELKAIRKLPVQYVALSRLHRLCGLMRAANVLVPEWLEEWRKKDRMLWQSCSHIAARARNRRKDFYRNFAANLATSYSSITIEPLDLSEAALKLNEVTGEKTEFAKKARSGRVVAAIYELESAIRQAAAKHGCALFEASIPSVSFCAHCGGKTMTDEESQQILHCTNCGAVTDRKLNGAANAWAFSQDQLEDAVEDFWLKHEEDRRESQQTSDDKKAKMAEARRNARTSIAGEKAAGSRA